MVKTSKVAVCDPDAFYPFRRLVEGPLADPNERTLHPVVTWKRPKPLRPSPSVRPEDAPLGSLESRAAARAWLRQNQQRIQMIVSAHPDDTWLPLNLANSSVTRQIWPNGDLFELIALDGRAEDITEEQLQAFINQHPIQRNDDGQLERNDS